MRQGFHTFTFWFSFLTNFVPCELRRWLGVAKIKSSPCASYGCTVLCAVEVSYDTQIYLAHASCRCNPARVDILCKKALRDILGIRMTTPGNHVDTLPCVLIFPWSSERKKCSTKFMKILDYVRWFRDDHPRTALLVSPTSRSRFQMKNGQRESGERFRLRTWNRSTLPRQIWSDLNLTPLARRWPYHSNIEMFSIFDMCFLISFLE